MKNQLDHAQRHVGLILALVGFISAATLMSGLARLVSAQAVAPSWSYTGNLNTPRQNHTATLLPDGKVLIASGVDANTDLRTESAELYDPGTGTWTFTGSLNTGREGHTATLLPNGKVLIAGGFHTNSAELYDPATKTWTNTGNLNASRVWPTATLLGNGKVLLAGGYDCVPGGPCRVRNSAELYDPATGTWSNIGSLNVALPSRTATLLPSGKVLVVSGGIVEACGSELCDDVTVNGTELYDPASGTWNYTGNLHTSRSGGYTTTLLPNGKVLIAGGYDFARNSAELYDPATGTWSSTGNLNEGRGDHTATLLPNGKVLVAAGFNSGTFLNSAELYDPATETWSHTANLNTARYAHTATLLLNGAVLVTGRGESSTELYGSGTNPIDDARFFVRQHYLDFLNREPEQRGLDDWMNFLNSCPAGDLACLHEHRLTASADFFSSPEFQLKGYFVFRFYRTAFDRLPTYDEIAPDMQGVTGQTPGEVYQKKANFTNSFVQRLEFANGFGALSNANYAAALLNRYQLTAVTTPDPGNPDGTNKVTISQFELVSRLDATTLTRAQVLRAIADSDEVLSAEFNRAFVAMQYYGYLRRTPELKGYNEWLKYLTDNPTDFREMVRGFVDSVEYRRRFGQP